MKKRVRYETVWRIRWSAGDADFKDEAKAEKKSNLLREHGVHCEVDSFKRVVLSKRTP
jgi:hypothetical protein